MSLHTTRQPVRSQRLLRCQFPESLSILFRRWIEWISVFFTAESFDPYGRRRHQSVAQTLSMPEIMDAISPAELGVLDFIGLRLLGCIQTFLI